MVVVVFLKRAVMCGFDKLTKLLPMAKAIGIFLRVCYCVYIGIRHPCPLCYEHIIDPQYGMLLYYITPQELISDWGFSIDIIVRIVDNNENYMDAIEQLKAMTRTISAYIEQDQVEIHFAFYEGYITSPQIGQYVWYYDLTTDTFEKSDSSWRRE